jgi:hypothetical protein
MAEPLEGQAIIITHDNARTDKEIIINGPYHGTQFIEEVAKFSQEERWQKPVPPQTFVEK